MASSIDNLGQKVGVFLLSLILVGGAILGIDHLRTSKYQSTAKYMVVLEENEDMTPLNASDVGNHLAELTTEIIDTDSFTNKIYQQSDIIYNISETKDYRKLIEAKVIKETEMVEISVIDEVPQRAQRICQAIIDELRKEIKNTNWNQKNFEVEVIDPPSLPREPIFPRPTRDVVVGLVATLILVSLYYLVLGEE